MRSFRSRPPMVRLAVAMLVLGFGVASFTGLWSTPSAEPTVQAFLLAWQDGQYQAAAGLTTGTRAEVARALHDAYVQLDAAAFYFTMGPITQQADTAHAAFQATIDLGQAAAPWKYQGRFQLRRAGTGWKIVWGPGVINPHLRPGLRLAVRSSISPRAQVLDAAGQPLEIPSAAFVAGVRPDRLTNAPATARGLARVTGLDAAQLLGWIQAAPEKSFSELVTFPPAQYHRLARALRRVPGLIVKPEQLRLFASIAPGIVGSVGTEAAPELRAKGIAYRPGTTVGLSGLQRAYQMRLAGTPTTEVVTETATGKHVRVLAQWRGQPSTPVHTTIDSRTQQAANAAVRIQGASAALVAVNAATGAVLAAASRTSPGLPGINPLAGEYPPGTAFTVVSAQALLAGGLRTGRPVPCFPSNAVGGSLFKNVPRASGPTVNATVTDDFAYACGTAFAGLSWRLTGTSLDQAAARFGLGARMHLPLPAFSGVVGPVQGASQLAAATIGQGGVRVSPLAMALAAGEVDSGNWHAPSLVTGPGAGVQQAQATVGGPAGLATLRQLMRAVVRSGAATGANLPGQPVFGQVGAAQLQPGPHQVWVSWFVGYRGGVAFAAVELSRSPGTSAVPLARSFLFQGG